jgi:hypothetical protein
VLVVGCNALGKGGEIGSRKDAKAAKGDTDEDGRRGGWPNRVFASLRDGAEEGCQDRGNICIL